MNMLTGAVLQGLRIAVIGAGTAGLAAAAFLTHSGHEVILYERFDAPKPVGAGLLLQPTGLSVLSMLGLEQQVLEMGSRIERLYGRVSGSTFTTLDVRYKSMSEHLFGIGIHRGSLFSILYDEVKRLGISIHAGNEIADAKNEGKKSILVNAHGEQYGPFDAVVDASGAKSALRRKYADVKLDKPYPYGAVWSIVKNTGGRFVSDTMEQRYKHAYHMIGVLPAGRFNSEPVESLAFFWSMKVTDYSRWRTQDFSAWQDYVINLWPETEVLVRQMRAHDDLAFASYSDVILRKYYSGNIVFIGDAAHCTSPQLGQGANLALMDAMVLAQCITTSGSLQEAWHSYTEIRKRNIEFYQMASRMLTPFFQSDSLFFAYLRFLTCGVACKIPFSQKMAAHILTGTRAGWFSTLNPGEWAQNYDLLRHSSNARIE